MPRPLKRINPYIPEKVIGHLTNKKGVTEYLIIWKNFSDNYRYITWEPEKNCNCVCPDLITIYKWNLSVWSKDENVKEPTPKKKNPETPKPAPKWKTGPKSRTSVVAAPSDDDDDDVFNSLKKSEDSGKKAAVKRKASKGDSSDSDASTDSDAASKKKTLLDFYKKHVQWMNRTSKQKTLLKENLREELDFYKKHVQWKN